MRAYMIVGVPAALIALVATSCATSPEVATRYHASQDRIATILAQSAQTPELGPPERCLGDLEYRNFRALDDQYILFEGRKDRLWINKLPMRCFDLEYSTVLRIRQFSAIRLCEHDTFMPGDWFDWPWYRRWPWHWGRWPTGATCTLGMFYPVNDEQLLAIEAAIRAR